MVPRLASLSKKISRQSQKSQMTRPYGSRLAKDPSVTWPVNVPTPTTATYLQIKMMVTLSEFTDQIQKAGLGFELVQDSRGTVPGGPVELSITRGKRPFINLALRTLNCMDRSPQDTESYFITHVTIEDAATLRVQKQLAPVELWTLVYETRMQSISPPQEQRPRYVTRPSKHYRTF